MMIDQDFTQLDMICILLWNKFSAIKYKFKDLELIIGRDNSYFIIRHQNLISVGRMNQFFTSTNVANVDSVFFAPLQFIKIFTNIIRQRIYFQFDDVHVPSSKIAYAIGSSC